MPSVQHPEAFIAPQTGVSTLILGDPGITKTRSYEAFARCAHRKFESIIPSQRDPADIVGYPSKTTITVPSKGEIEVADFIPARWMVEMEFCQEIWPDQVWPDGHEGYDGGFALFDEALDCSPQHQAAIQQILNDGIKNCWVAACGNPVEVSTNGFELSAPVVNRMCILDYKAPVDEWKTNMMTDFADVPSKYPMLPANWRKTHMPEARGLVLGFIEAQPQTAQKCPDQRADKAKPWPSLRSWTNAATLIAAAKSVGASRETTRRMVTGCVGQGASQKFFAWVDAQDLPSVLDVLSNPSIFDFGRDGSRTYAVLAGVISYMLANLDDQIWNQAADVMVYAGKDALSIASAGALQISRVRPSNVRYSKEFHATFGELFRDVASQRSF